MRIIHLYMKAACWNFSTLKGKKTVSAMSRGIGGEEVEEALFQQRWATSYDAWLNVPPGENEQEPIPLIYFRPCGPQTNAGQKRKKKKLPSVIRGMVLYALTGSNPMGVDHEEEWNAAANKRMRQDIQKLQNPMPRYTWDAFGFGAQDDWREEGFVVAYDQLEKESSKDALIDLARKYEQAAIYEFVVEEDDNGISNAMNEELTCMRRKTIPVGMNNVEAEVLLEACDKPEGIQSAEASQGQLKMIGND